MSLLRLALFVFLLAPTAAFAQTGARSETDSLFLRAQRLVNEGQGDAGRALVESALADARPGTPRHAEALFWRAVLAPTAAEAERDYRRLTVEYPLSPRTEEALIALAQLEIARRDYPMALRHLDRVKRDFPASGTIPRAHFWTARVHLEEGDLPRGCASLGAARSATPRTNVELQNQIDFYAQRCLGVDTAGIAATSAIAAAPPASTPASPPRTTPVTSAPPAASPQSVASTPPAARPPATATEAASTGVQYTVQIAALNARAPAEELRDKLRARGYEARVVGVGQLFRVRIGRYGSREEAARVAADLREKGISRDAWVAEAEAR